MRLPRNPSRPIVTRHRGSPRLNREQPRQNSPRPLIVSSLSAFTERPAPPYQPPRTMIYVAREGTGPWFPSQRETSSLSWSRGYQRELSPSVHCSRRAQKRSRARFRSVRARIHYPWLRVHRRDRTREKDTFSREKLLSNAITICYGAVTAKRLNDDRHRCAYMLRTRACMCVYASLMRGEERKIERRKESGRSIDIDQLAGIGPRMRELIKPNH